MTIIPIELFGPWTKGYAIDNHMISSKYIGEDVFGHARYDNTRSTIGEMVYQLKYRMDLRMIENIMKLIIPFLDSWTQLKSVDIVIPAPPSNIQRQWQPVYEIAGTIAKHLKVPFHTDVIHKINTIQSKDLSTDEKSQLTSSIVLDKRGVRAYNILIVDDLYDSGSTLHEITAALRSDPMVKDIFVLTMTKTKERI